MNNFALMLSLCALVVACLSFILAIFVRPRCDSTGYLVSDRERSATKSSPLIPFTGEEKFEVAGEICSGTFKTSASAKDIAEGLAKLTGLKTSEFTVQVSSFEIEICALGRAVPFRSISEVSSNQRRTTGLTRAPNGGLYEYVVGGTLDFKGSNARCVRIRRPVIPDFFCPAD